MTSASEMIFELIGNIVYTKSENKDSYNLCFFKFTHYKEFTQNENNEKKSDKSINTVSSNIYRILNKQ